MRVFFNYTTQKYITQLKKVPNRKNCLLHFWEKTGGSHSRECVKKRREVSNSGIILVRQKISLRPKATGKILSLFEEDEIMNGYRHSCYVTSLLLPAAEVWRIYRSRAMAENKIKELKYDYAIDKINQHGFDATEATINFIMVAYNLMSIFKQVIVQDKIKPTLKTIRYKCLAIGSYIVKDGNERILKMSVHMRRRSWITKLWESIDGVKAPFINLSG